MCGHRSYFLNKSLTPSKVLFHIRQGQVQKRRKEDGNCDRSPDVCTLVMSDVAASISLSSALRSVNPGKTCFACSFSSDVTAKRR